jgi:glutamyl-tRNA synthetase
MTLDEMIARFDINNLTPAPPAINFAKLDHFNATHIRQLQAGDLAARIKPYFVREGLAVEDAKLMRIIPLIRERLVTLDDCLPFAAWFFKETVTPEPAELVAKGLSASQTAGMVRQSYEILAVLPELRHDLAEPPMRNLVEQLGLGPNQVFGSLRVAITGQPVSPPLFESMEIVGKEKVLERLNQAIKILEELK